MSRLDGLCRHAFPQARGLGWKGRRAKPDLETASRRCEPVKGRQHEVVQHRLERDRWICRQRITQRQRPVCRQFGDEPVRQRLCRVLIILFGFSRVTGDRDRRALHGSTGLLTLGGRRVDALSDFRIRCGSLVLRPDITPVRREPSFGIDADEDAGTDDVGRIIDHGPFLERHQCRFDLAEALIDLIG